jgi:hypothetical protein
VKIAFASKLPLRAAASLVLLLLVPRAVLGAWNANGVNLSGSGIYVQPTLVPDGSGGAFFVWQGGPGVDVFAQRVTHDGAIAPAWPQGGGLPVCNAAGTQETPTLAPDSAGGVFIAWKDSRYGSQYDIYAQHLDGNGQIVSGWPANGRAICATAGNQHAPSIAPDGTGGAFLAWQDGRSGTSNYDIYVVRISAAGDPMPGWPPSGLAVCTAPNHQLTPVVLPDGAGGAYVAWQDFRNGIDYDIYASHLTSDGALVSGWASGGRAVCNSPNSQYSPVLASDGSGGAYVVWQDYRSGTDNDIYGQHLLFNGSVAAGWVPNGSPVCAARNSQYYPVVAADGSGGVLIAWQDSRTGIDNDIYATKLTGNGAPAAGWPVDGRPVSRALNGQFYPRIAGDGSGGAFVTWYDNRSGATADIYVQRVDAQGNLSSAWPEDGFEVCDAPESQLYPVIASNGAGSAVMTWQDQRTGDPTIYAQQAIAPNVTGVGQDGPRSFLSNARPNPSTLGVQFSLSLATRGRVEMEVFDIGGRRVRSFEPRTMEAGEHMLRWDGITTAGQPARAGLYLVRVRWPGATETRRVVRIP